MIGVLIYLAMIVGVILVVASIVGLIVRKVRKMPRKPILWVTLVIGILLCILPYALLVWAVLTI